VLPRAGAVLFGLCLGFGRGISAKCVAVFTRDKRECACAEIMRKQSIIRTQRAALAQSVSRFSEIMRKQKPKARCRLILSSSAL
jgi:hypothetical protein